MAVADTPSGTTPVPTRQRVPHQRTPGDGPPLAWADSTTVVLPGGGYNYSGFSVLAGPADPAPACAPACSSGAEAGPEAGPEDGPDPAGYRVRMRPLARRRPVTTVLITVFAFLFESTFFMWLLSSIEVPDHTLNPARYAGTIVMIGATALIELFRLVNVVTLCLATLWARDPVPVVPQAGLRVAFLTTIVPGKEPVDMVERTLRAALAVRHPGRYDVWLLDEGDDAQVKAMCARIGVHHFTRKGNTEFNTAAGAHKAKTKHGNYNSWVRVNGDDYDVFVSVDPDHVPLPNFAERLLGYFHDPDVAFVVGPQIYGNYDNVVTRWAESQQYLFHSLLQRAGNRQGIAMLVGTNNAVRIAALRSIGGLQDSITEDMATSLVMHSTDNPATGRRWRSVYTPDVLAVGEGPSSWTDYFTQQHRWSRGTNEVAVTSFARLSRRLGGRRSVHYALLMSYYPLTALAWLLGAVNAACYLVLGAKGVQVPQQVWLMLYVDAALFQIGLYLWNRRHNISPHEEVGSSGLTGMLVSTLSTPVYVSSFVSAVLRRTSGFVVTPKGDSASPDRLLTFRQSLQWAAFYALLLLIAPITGHVNGAMWVWPFLNLAICLTPPAVWMLQDLQRRAAARTIRQKSTEEYA